MPTKTCIVKAMIFWVVMYGCELDHKEGWAPKTWCFWIMVLENTLENPLDCKEIKPVSPKGNQSWVFIRRSDVEIIAPILWPPNVKNLLIGKDTDTEKAEKDWGQEENVRTENEMIGRHACLNGHESLQTPGDSEGQGSLACYSSWGRKCQTGLHNCTKTASDKVVRELLKWNQTHKA